MDKKTLDKKGNFYRHQCLEEFFRLSQFKPDVLVRTIVKKIVEKRVSGVIKIEEKVKTKNVSKLVDLEHISLRNSKAYRKESNKENIGNREKTKETILQQDLLPKQFSSIKMRALTK